jgi:ABC-type multidrug transport system, ATPase component
LGFRFRQKFKTSKSFNGIVPQEVNFDPFFTPKQLLELQAGLFGIKKKDRITDTILKLVSLEDQASSYSRSLSGGMKRRLLVAKAMVHQPPIIILDEPTAGVDVELRKKLWDNVKSLNKKGVTIILTTHYLEEAEKMCNRIGILNHGELVALDTTHDLIEKIQTKIVNFKIDKKSNFNDDTLESVKIIHSDENKLIVSYEKSKINIDTIISKLNEQNIRILDISTDDGDLEDVFLRLTKN